MLIKFFIVFLGALFPMNVILITNSYNISNIDLVNTIVFIFLLSLFFYIPLFLNIFKKLKYEFIFIIFIIILSIFSLFLKFYGINSLSIKNAILIWLLIGVLSFSIVYFNIIVNFRFLINFLIIFFISSLFLFFTKPFIEKKQSFTNLTFENVFEESNIKKVFSKEYTFFYIVLDGFPRLSNLEQINYDTSNLKNIFKKYDLRNLNETNSDYLDTQKSISSSMNFGKIKNNINLEKKYFYKFINNSKIVNLFHKNGYEILWFPSDQALSNCPTHIDVRCISSPYKIKLLNKEIIKFYLGILQFQTYWIEKINMYIITNFFKNDFRSIYHLDVLTNYFKKNQINTKKFVFSHILVPHPPYLLNSNCGLQKFALDYKLFDREKILEQIDCFSLQLESFLKTVSEQVPNAVFFIHSDHGTPIISETLYGEENYENFVLISEKLNCDNNLFEAKTNLEITKKIIECI